ncbi:hypothetical protein V9T40_014230 [Parthenolecanium corni]|uniref:Uncharacterized protein n=1 Tax=Parthenolecanium corni TaxID=536013 RepID=A0AAN9TQJ8_9HEMI
MALRIIYEPVEPAADRVDQLGRASGGRPAAKRFEVPAGHRHAIFRHSGPKKVTRISAVHPFTRSLFQNACYVYTALATAANYNDKLDALKEAVAVIRSWKYDIIYARRGAARRGADGIASCVAIVLAATNINRRMFSG